MSEECQSPLVPEGVDLTDFKFMPLEVARLLRSEFWMDAMDADTRIAAASINLWAESWHQRPAASLPNNDGALARLAMVDKAVWREIRDAVMGPWVLCSDGRWYHPVVAEKANEAWAEKQDYQRRKAAFSQQQKARIAKRWNREKSAEDTKEDTTEDTGRIADCNTNERDRDREKERDRDYKSAKALSPTADAAGPSDAGPKGEGYTTEFETWWSLYPRKDGKGGAFRAFLLAKKLVGVPRLMEGVRAYSARMKGEDLRFVKHAATWLNQHCWNDEAQTPQKPKHPPGYVPMAANGG